MSRRTLALVAAVMALLPSPTPVATQAATSCAAPPLAAPFAPQLAEARRLYRGAWSPDGRVLYYFKKVTEGREDYRIFRAPLDGTRWGAAEQVTLGLEGVSDLYPVLSRDGRRLVFSSYRPLPGADSAAGNAHLWYVDRQGTGWGPPVPITTVNLPGHYHSGPTLTAAGDLRFTRTTPDWRTRGLLQSQFRDGQYGVAADPGYPDVLTASPEGYRNYGPTFSPDGRLAILGIARVNPETRRQDPLDLWFSRLENGRWSAPTPLGGGVTTAADENFPFFSPDGCALYFTRDYSTFHHVSVAAAVAR